MKELLIRFPDKQEPFILELLEQLGIEKEQTDLIPEEHKNLVRERLIEYKTNPSIASNIEDALKDIENDF
jgi:hypothetical protein